MYKLIAFDFDGTIADTIPFCIQAFQKGVSPYAGHMLTEKEITETFGLNEIGMVKAVVEKDWEAAIEDYYRYYEKLHDKVAEPFPGIRELILSLKQRGILVALVTGKAERSCMISLRKLKLDDLFSDILCGSEFSPNKAESINLLLKKYALSTEELCYIGDALSDVDACRKAGVPCLSAAWSSSADRSALEKKNPGLVFSSVEALSDRLK